MSEERFEELASYLYSLREIPLNVLPRRSTHSRASFSSSASATHAPSERAPSISSDGASFSGSRFLSKTFSSTRDAAAAKESLSPTSASEAVESAKKSASTPANAFPTQEQIDTGSAKPPDGQALRPPDRPRPKPLGKGAVPPLPLAAKRSSSMRRPRGMKALAMRDAVDLNLSQDDIDSYLRLRYDVIHRTHSGDLILRTPSQWDAFHSRRIWGVIGIVDCSDPELSDNEEERSKILAEAQEEFMAALKHFPASCVSRVIVFTTPDAAKQRGAQSVMNSPSVGGRMLHVPPAGELVFGYVPESAKFQETRLELKVQVVHLAGLLLNTLDKECWKIERSSNELFLSPLDEPNTPDKQSKLVKRRPGRQDKLLADTHLMMGSPGDALAKYVSAIEKAKANSDRLWLAGAMEGWSSAHVLCYIKGGGAVGDVVLSNKLIEHYADIYKLYSKKRIPELEALAALRLAEFLGRFTKRRKEALEAADHAAVCGEALSSQKRAALWESLARFSEYMKWHRKAAFYMYRVGNICAIKSVWSSSEALLTASAKQFRHASGKTWPDLHRDILMEAGKSAWEVGDSFLATRHYVEALSLSASTLRMNKKSDASLVALLVETTTPAYLPAAGQLVHLQGLNAKQIPSLLVKENAMGDGVSNSPLVDKNGPFIYNPFEARARRKAEAAASRTVTWVCGEAAQVALHIQNQTHTDLPVEIIAVAIVDANQSVDVWPAREGQKNGLSQNGGEGKHFVETCEDPQATHARKVKTLLRNVTRTVETLSETVMLPPLKSAKFVEKTVTVFPRKTGEMRICGLVARLFRGAIVFLKTPEPVKGQRPPPPINVIRELPRLDVSIKQEDGEFSAFNMEKAPAVIFEGERRRFSVRVKNIGRDEIADPRIQITSSNPSLIEITKSDDELSCVGKTPFKSGVAYEFSVDAFANRICVEDEGDSEGALNVSVVYAGKTNRSMIRESRAVVCLVVRPAIRIGSFSPFKLPLQNGMYEEEPGRAEARYGLILDVENCVSMPVMIALPPSWRSPDIIASPKFKGLNMFGLDSPCPTVNVLEVGASTRLITVIPREFFSAKQETDLSSLALSWAMPGLARNGIAEIFRDDIMNVGSFIRKSSGDSEDDPFNRADNAQMEMKVTGPSGVSEETVDASADSPSVSDKHGKGVRSVHIRKYYTGTVVVHNRGSRAFPIHTVLDMCVLQHDGRGGARLVQTSALVGSVECVRIGALAPGKSFEHSFKIRFTSAGAFELNGFVHDWADATESSLDAVLIEARTEAAGYGRKSRAAFAGRSQSLRITERPKSTGFHGLPPMNGGPRATRVQSMHAQTMRAESRPTRDDDERPAVGKRTRSLVNIRKERDSSPDFDELVSFSISRPTSAKARGGERADGGSGALKQIDLTRVLCRYTTPFYVIADKWDTSNLNAVQSPFGPHAVPVSSAGSGLRVERSEKPKPDKMF